MIARPSPIASAKRWRRSMNAPRSWSGLMRRLSLEAEGVGQQLVRADARLEIVGDGDDDELLDAVSTRHRLELFPHDLWCPGHGPAPRVLDDRQIARGVGKRFRFLDRGERAVASGVEAEQSERATFRELPRFLVRVRTHGPDGGARQRGAKLRRG